MKITSRRLSIPPYVSCSWDQVSSLHVEELDARRDLIIFMTSGARVTIPHLSETLIDMIFTAHGEFLDQGSTPDFENSSIQIEGALPPGLIPLSGNILGGGIADLMQHNPTHKDMPDLSAEVLEKVVGMIKIIAPDDIGNLSPSEPHCNCIHCQVSRSANSQITEEASDEVVSESDLTFKEWDVTPEGENLYLVRHPIEANEEYHVFLGNPIGCTCGSKQCEHIAAALRT